MWQHYLAAPAVEGAACPAATHFFLLPLPLFLECRIHDITVASGATLNVFNDGYGVDLNLDHHRAGPYGELIRWWRGVVPLLLAGGAAALACSAAGRLPGQYRIALLAERPTLSGSPLLPPPLVTPRACCSQPVHKQ